LFGKQRVASVLFFPSFARIAQV